MVRVKVCGLTNLDDALAAANYGADALGFILAESPRRVAPDQIRRIVAELPPLVLTVGVFVDTPPVRVRAIRDYCGLDAVQLHGRETEDQAEEIGGRVIKALRVADQAPRYQSYPSAALLLDTYSPGRAGGTGQVFDWTLAREAVRHRPIILAGGLNDENIIEAVTTVQPYAVDVSSGVESSYGRKDHVKLERFIKRAKSLD